MQTIQQMLKAAYGEQGRAAENAALANFHAPDLATIDQSVWGLVSARAHAISHAVVHTCLRNDNALTRAVSLTSSWMKERAIVRVLGAGRALLAASVPANRLAHGGAQVSIMGGMVPLPNSIAGGGIL
ncbi:MAG: hypothetical protein WBM24_20975, partial [Candidatus Sulfotelmatobacter sp.]